MNNQLLNNYQKLKWKFFSNVNKKSIGYKGDIRAFIGERTWFHERESTETDPIQRHYLAFQLALSDFEQTLSKEQFKNELNDALDFWRIEGREIKRKPFKDPIISPPVKEIKKWKKNGKNFISLFSGAFGLDLGFMAVGFKPLMALDIEESSYKTINTNLPKLPFIREDVNTVTTKRILDEVGLDVGELDVVTGGPHVSHFLQRGKDNRCLTPVHHLCENMLGSLMKPSRSVLLWKKSRASSLPG